jgi:hypothetical protein
MKEIFKYQYLQTLVVITEKDLLLKKHIGNDQLKKDIRENINNYGNDELAAGAIVL